MGTRETADFEGLGRAYAAAIEPPSFGARLRQDPELRKHLARIYTAIADARRLHQAGTFAGDEAGPKIGAVAFAAGFSEPFLLGVVERIGKLDEKDNEEKCESA